MKKQITQPMIVIIHILRIFLFFNLADTFLMSMWTLKIESIFAKILINASTILAPPLIHNYKYSFWNVKLLCFGEKKFANEIPLSRVGCSGYLLCSDYKLCKGFLGNLGC